MRRTLAVRGVICGALLLSACGSKSPTVTTTEVPIRSETAPIDTVPTETTAPAVTTTTAPPIYETTVLVRYEPKNADEQELIDAAKVLFPKSYRSLFQRLSIEQLEEVFTPDYASQIADFRVQLQKDGWRVTSREGARYVVTGAARESVDLGLIKICQIDTGVSVRSSPDGNELERKDSVESLLQSVSLKMTAAGWRITDTATLENVVGEDICAK